MATFNGHKNWNHWNVALWINNDQGLYDLAWEATRRYSRDEAARRILDALPPATPDGAPYTFTSVRAALRGF